MKPLRGVSKRLVALALSLGVGVGVAAYFARRPEPPPEPVSPIAGPDTDVALVSTPVAEAAPARETPAAARVSIADVPVALETSPAPSIDLSLPTAVWRAIVSDERSGARLDRYAVEIADVAGRRVVAVTDDKGELASEPVAFGMLQVTALDHPARPLRPAAREVQHSPGDERRFPLRVESGPTYRVRVSEGKPVPLDTIVLRADFANPAEERTWFQGEPLRVAAPYVAAGESPWVRFPAPPKYMTRLERVVAVAGDGLWSAETRKARTIVGVASEPLVLDFWPRALLSGVVRDESGPVRDAIVTPYYKSRKPNGPGPLAVRTDADGRYRLSDLAAGDLLVRVASLPHEDAQVTVTLESNQERTHDFALVSKPAGGVVRGHVRSDSGRYSGSVTVVLTRLDGEAARAPRRREVQFGASAPNEPDGRFDFGSVPAGKYRVELREKDFFVWEKPPREFTVPCEPLEFRVHDLVATADLVLDVTDAGRPLTDFHVHLWTTEGERKVRASSGDVLLAGYPEDKKLTWRLDAPGHPPIVGDLASFESRTVVGDRMRRTFVRASEPGFGEALRATNRKDKKPIAGAIVLLDGVEAGKTDGNGRVFVTAREAPREITVRHDKYRPQTVAWKPPETRGFEREIGVTLQPNGKK